ncbi:MAG: hypothetical protein V4732_14975 [Pseudomonadota bacterium]
MKILPIPLFFIVILLALNIAASEIYLCKSSEGKNSYSDKPCATGESQEKRDFKDLPWTKTLDASKPAGTEIIEVTKDNGDTIIKYAFFTGAELKKFMKSAQQLSGMNVNLLKFKAPKNGGRGEALIQVTSKADTVFKSGIRISKHP